MADDQNTLQEQLIEKNKTLKRTILYAEDDKINVFLMERILKPLGFNLDIAENGSIAVDMCKQKQYDIILMDIYMPIMDGLEASKQIKNIYKTIPIIAVTAGTFNNETLKSEYGIDYLVNKPVKIFELMKLLIELT
jgi:CheY-like chemotaxis protein